MLKFHILIISDIHLGSKFCNAKKLLEFLRGCFYDLLIILGDLYEKGETISDEQFEVVKYLRGNREKVRYVEGNHDPAGKTRVNEFLNMPVLKKYEWSMNGKDFCAIHGHQFDRLLFIFDEPLVDKIFYRFTWLFKMINIFGVNGTGWHDSAHEFFSYLVDKRAERFARKKKKKKIICGHTHKPVHRISYNKNGEEIHYVNSGGWVGDLCSYVAIDEGGDIKLDSLVPSPE